MTSDIIALISSIVSIVASFIAIFEGGKRVIKLLFFVVGVAVFFFALCEIKKQSAGIVYTKINELKNDNYSGTQQQYYYTPLVIGDESLTITYLSRGEEAEDPQRARFSGIGVSSNSDIAKMNEKPVQELPFDKKSLTQYFSTSDFVNSMDIQKEDSEWHRPKGWAGFEYANTKIPEGKEIIFILDFSEIAKASLEFLPPCYAVIRETDLNSRELTFRGKFKPLNPMESTSKTVWFKKISAKPNRLIVFRWATKTEMGSKTPHFGCEAY